MAYADTVEADVYFSLSKRIGLFQGVVGKLQPILSKLPKEFEAAALRRAEDRDRGPPRAVRNVEVMVGEAEQAAFDIDQVSEADLAPPEFPPSPMMPEDLDRVLHDQRLLPPGVECNELDPRTYAISIPGSGAPARITTSPDVFDDHFESLQLVLYDGPIFTQLTGMADAGAVVDPAVLPANGTTLRQLLDSET